MKIFLKGTIEKSEGDVLSVAVASDASIDRDGEVVDPSGIDTRNFERNPVLLYAHDYRSDPIGKVISIQRDASRMLFSAQFATDISERAKLMFDLVKGGFLNAFSIGFIPKEWKDEQKPDGSQIRTFTKTELLEISLVPVPANPNALVLARAYKSADGKEIDTKILEDMEKHKDGDVLPEEEAAPTPEPEAEEDDVDETEGIKASLKVLTDKVEKLEKEVANKGEERGTKAPSVEELLRHPDFHRGVLTSVDKALGLTLGRMKQRR